MMDTSGMCTKALLTGISKRRAVVLDVLGASRSPRYLRTTLGLAW